MALRPWTSTGKVPAPYTKLFFALRKTISELLKVAPRGEVGYFVGRGAQ